MKSSGSWTEKWVRNLVIQFLNDFIATGSLILLEEDGTSLTFGGTDPEKCSLEVSVKVHNPQFYWKVATEADLGFADAYIDRDISFVDQNEGLLNLFLILISSRDVKAPSESSTKRGWWTPLLMSAGLASARYFFKHVLRKNSLTQARRNISQHYDLSNELFSLFLDETMSYSSGIFKFEDEELKTAQLRKISSLIEKAKIKKEHHVLDIGCGWGTLAIEAVKRTGCQYTGITLSEKQLIYAENKVKEAGLQEHIKFLLCDYRQLPDTIKYDRIISCEMLEHVGHEFYEKFFSCCESALADNGVFVLQFISIPDQRYEEYRQSPDFIREYIFPGGCLPSLTRVMTAMNAASKLCVENVENIGFHYYPTLRYWRENFIRNKSEILDLGFDEKFIRTWEYYFDYCAAGFKTCTLGDYQVVFSRPGNVSSFGTVGNKSSPN
ncbi:OLC1v1019601C2 [Oldenlandia corymbosa var. corymbosa]|uniref:OLC1v1019601C2 n=1 Tax=Oldenlandia corymbosa var. corymbosa TaxID=529605 RepID=A0AAV1EEV4_OLDCO|nr:OLC1v1019601C2 [Oldenlandia corymbosa var. corymbosa]